MPADNFLWFPEAAKGGLLSEKAAKPLGETTDAFFKSKNALEVMSFGFGISQAETSGSGSPGAGAGKAKFEEFEIKKGVDLASVPLYNACAAGAHFPSICLAIRKAGGSSLIYLQYIFRMVFVTSINWSGGGGDAAPEETIKFKFGALGIRYVQQNASGQEMNKIDGMWSVVTNKNSLDVPGLGAAPPFLESTPKA